MKPLQKGKIKSAIEMYREGEVSLDKAAKIAGVSLSRMMDILKEYGVEANIDYEDYLRSLQSLREIW